MGRVGGLGLGGLVLVVLVSLLLGQNPLALLGQLGGGEAALPPSSQAQTEAPPAGDTESEFVRAVLGSTEDVWGPLFANSGEQYPAPTLVLYDDVTRTACGYGQAATGPFYCPADQQIYLDLGFLDELRRLGATGDFAVAYVIAHEVGHHIQRVTGIEPEVRRAQEQARSQDEVNELSVRLELQADCYAGVWGYHADQAQNLLERGDVQEGLNAAAAIGDDRLQRMSGQAVQPDAFTHGSSAQRQTWFRRGLESGDMQACNTFEGY